MQQQLEQRIELLRKQLEQTNSQVLTVSENLSQLKNQANQVAGHLNEAQYLLGEFQKTQPTNEVPMDNLHHVMTDSNALPEHEALNS